MSKKQKPDEHQLGDAPIQADMRAQMNAVAATIDDLFNGDAKPKKVGFILMLFPFDSDSGRCNYISNAERKEVVTLLKEQIARFEGRYHDDKRT